MTSKGESPSKRQPRKKATTKKTSAKAKKVKATGTNPDQMSPEVVEFITAIDDYKRRTARKFPSWSEVLEIVKELGYRKVS